MQHRGDGLATFTQRLSQATNTTAIQQSLQDAVAPIGFSRFAWIQLRPRPLGQLPTYLGNYDPTWTAHYVTANLAALDPVRHHALQATTPYLWDDVRPHDKDIERQVFGPATELGMRSGVAIPVHGPHGHVAALFVATDASPAETRDMARTNGHDLWLTALLVGERLTALSQRSNTASAPLTRRQREVLTLAARGLQNKQIAHELGIAPDVVRQHLQEAYRKLGVQNRTRATALALTRGLIQL